MRHLDSIFFTSDRKRTSCLYSVDVSTIIELFEQTGRDYASWPHRKLGCEEKRLYSQE